MGKLFMYNGEFLDIRYAQKYIQYNSKRRSIHMNNMLKKYSKLYYINAFCHGLK